MNRYRTYPLITRAINILRIDGTVVANSEAILLSIKRSSSVVPTEQAPNI